MEDNDIVALFFNRDENAVLKTKEKYGGLCLGIAGNILKNRGDAEECFSDALMALWKSIPPTRPANFKAYLCKITRNLCMTRLDYVTAEKRSASFEVPLSELGEVLPDGGAQGEIDRVEFAMLLNEFLSEINPEQRKIFVRRYFFFDSVADISEDLGLSQSGVKSSLLRTRRRLKKFLTEKECGL